MKVAGEVDLFATEAEPEECELFAHLSEGAIAVLGAMPATDNGGGGNADAEKNVLVGMQRLERGRAHGSNAGSAELSGEYTCAEAESGLSGADSGQGGERLEASGFGNPERAVAGIDSPIGGSEPGGGAEPGEAGEGESQWVGWSSAHGR